MGKSVLLIFLFCAGLAAQSLRYVLACEVENAPTAEIASSMKNNCEGSVFIQGQNFLFQNNVQSLLTRKVKDGVTETLMLDHSKKQWKALPTDDLQKELQKEKLKNPMSELGMRIKTEIRSLNPDRVIDGIPAKGFEMNMSMDSSQSRSPEIAQMLPKMDFSIEMWIARDLRMPGAEEMLPAKGVGASEGLMRRTIQELFAMFDGGSEALARLDELPPGVLLETVMKMPSLMGQKGMIIRSYTKNISQEAIPGKVFAIPEGYRRVE